MKARSPTYMIFLSAVLAGGLLSPAAWADSSFDETLPIAPDATVEVENKAGSIRITGWDRDEVHIRAELGESVEELDVSKTANGLRIRVKNRRNERNIDGSELVLSIPRSARVDASSVSADISIEEMDTTSLVIDSVSGDIDIESRTTSLEADSVSGDITFQGTSERVAVDSVSGDIRLVEVNREVSVSTVSGDLELTGADISRGRFETVSGELELQLSLAENGRLNAESMSGDVELMLPATHQGEFTAETFSGDIRSDFGSDAIDSRGPGSSWSHSEGTSGRSIRIESFSGDITIRHP